MPPEIRRADGSLLNPGTERSGAPIGFDAGVVYETTTLQLAPGDVVVLRTDGVDEAMTTQSEQFGEARFRASLQASAHDPETICRNLLADVESFAGAAPQKDDITILAFGRM